LYACILSVILKVKKEIIKSKMTILSPILEDYLEVVLRFQREKHFARVSDISRTLSVGKSAVTAALKSLAEKGLVDYRSYEPVTLSRKGEQLAEHILLRRRIIQDFLEKVLAVDKNSAETTASKMEHAIDKDILDRFICLLAFISRARIKGKTLREEFIQFNNKGIGDWSCQQCIDDYMKELAGDEI